MIRVPLVDDSVKMPSSVSNSLPHVSTDAVTSCATHRALLTERDQALRPTQLSPARSSHRGRGSESEEYVGPAAEGNRV